MQDLHEYNDVDFLIALAQKEYDNGNIGFNQLMEIATKL